MKKTITADDFQVLQLNDKTQLVFEYGEELNNRFIDNKLVKLYVLFDFYVEITYLPKENKIEHIDIITDNHLAENYISDIDISDVFKKSN